MALGNFELYDALLDIGVDPGKARRAAEAAAWPNRELTEVRNEMRTEFASVRREMQTEFASVRTEMAGVKTDIAVLTTQMEHLNHRLTHVLTIAYLLLGGLVSTLWVLARH